MPSYSHFPKYRTSNIVIQEANNDLLIYDLIKNKAFSLNKTSATIWQACNGARTIEEIAAAAGKELNAVVNKELVWLALQQFNKDNLLEADIYNKSVFNRINRRELVRKLSISSIVALPIVSSLVAPPAINAISGACMGACQCPNSTTSFCSPNASSPTNCNALSPQTGTATTSCRCRGPFGADGSGTSSGQKTGNCSV